MDIRGKRLVVLGGAGLIGSHAVDQLLREDVGEVIVYDSKTLEIVKRLPMSKPVGKYNVYNKINLSEGTSH